MAVPRLLRGLGLQQAGQAQIVELAVVPVLEVVSICLLGYWLALPKVNILNRQAYQLLSKLVFALFLPCLIFSELGALVTWRNMLDWWFIPVNVILSSTIGCIFGYFVARICRPPPQFFRFTIIMTGIGNTGNLPFAIISSICGISNPFGDNCNQQGVAYVAFSQWVAVIIIYTFVYHMMEPPDDYYELVPYGDSGEVQEDSDDTEAADLKPPVLDAEWPGVDNVDVEDSKTPLLSRMFRTGSHAADLADQAGDDDDAAHSVETGSPRVRCIRDHHEVVEKIRIVAERTPLKHILQPPIVASMLAITVGMFPRLSSLLFGEDAPLMFVTDSLSILAGAMVPCIMLVLGGTFSEGPVTSSLGLRTTLGICVTRLLLLPLVGIGVVLSADKLGFIPPANSMFMFVLLLQHTMPSAILVGALTTLRGYAQKEAAAVLFWQHIFAVISVAFYITVYLNLIYIF